MSKFKKSVLAIFLALFVVLSIFAYLHFLKEPVSVETTVTTLAETTTEETTKASETTIEPSEETTPPETTTEPTTEQTTQKTTEESTADAGVTYGEYYYSKDEVALYIHIYSELPQNYITKKEAKALGWRSGSLEPYAPGKTIGGDKFGNYEGVLPEGDYHECDIDTLGKSKRGTKRIVFDSDGDIYYTDDHYATFTQLY